MTLYRYITHLSNRDGNLTPPLRHVRQCTVRVDRSSTCHSFGYSTLRLRGSRAAAEDVIETIDDDVIEIIDDLSLEQPGPASAATHSKTVLVVPF